MKIVFQALAIFCLFVSCSPSTEIVGAWKKPEINTPINSILVTAMTEKVNVRQTVEGDVSSALQEAGYKAIKSIDILPPNFTNGEAPDKEELLDKVNTAGADAIMTIALIDEDTETRFVPGATAYEPVPRFGYYGQFWGYYNAWYPALYAPGYYEESKVYFLETNLYNARTEELLWSAQSETINPVDLGTFSKEFSRVLLARLEDDGVLRKK